MSLSQFSKLIPPLKGRSASAATSVAPSSFTSRLTLKGINAISMETKRVALLGDEETDFPIKREVRIVFLPLL